MTKQIRTLSFVLATVLSAALTGCSQDLCRDDHGNQISCGGGYVPDGGTHDGSVITNFVVTGQIDSSFGTVTAVEMVSADLATVLVASCTMTAAGNGQTNFTCTATSAPADKRFLVRFTAGGAKYAVVTNYPGTSPTDTCALAHGVFINGVTVNGASAAHSIVDTAPGVATPSNDCREQFN
ncbi:MAG: hypothetical protein U0487_01285 [Patescibacteria group bacterium]